MKKILLVFSMVTLIGFGANAQGDMLTGGTFVQAGYFMPNSTYGAYAGTTPYAKKDYGFGASLQFGQNFTVVDLSTVAIGVRVTWIELAGATYKTPAIDKGYAFHGSLFKTGPQVGFAIGDEMAVDLFYQYSPSVMVLGEFGNSDAKSFTGFTQSAGFLFRYKRLNLGAEYAFGNIRDNDTRKGGDLEFLGKRLHRTTNVKLTLGIQFNK